MIVQMEKENKCPVKTLYATNTEYQRVTIGLFYTLRSSKRRVTIGLFYSL